MLLRRLLVGVFTFLCAVTVIAGELPLLLAERYTGGVDVSQYWVSEKLDGVRAHWDGRQLRFRSGNPVPVPRWFVAVLPVHALDGELWLGRGRFDQLSGKGKYAGLFFHAPRYDSRIFQPGTGQ